MVDSVTGLRLAAAAIGTLGGVLLFIEFFQIPSYVRYQQEWEQYDVEISPGEVEEYTWIGRIGALLLAIAFSIQFLTLLVG